MWLSRQFFILMLMAFICQACSNPTKKIYTSECSPDIKFKQISFVNLIDSVTFYDKQYVELSGTYVEGKHLSALVNDSAFADNGHSFWVNFTQDCPLYSSASHEGLFDLGNNINNHAMTIRGRVELSNKGDQKAYRATINEVSYLVLY